MLLIRCNFYESNSSKIGDFGGAHAGMFLITDTVKTNIFGGNLQIPSFYFKNNHQTENFEFSLI